MIEASTKLGHVILDPPAALLLRRLMETRLPEHVRHALGFRFWLPKWATCGEAIAWGMVYMAIQGKSRAVRKIRVAIEGCASRRIELIGAKPTRGRACPECRRGYGVHQ